MLVMHISTRMLLDLVKHVSTRMQLDHVMHPVRVCSACIKCSPHIPLMSECLHPTLVLHAIKMLASNDCLVFH